MAKLCVRFLGTGNAFNSDGRGSQAIWVEPGKGPPFLVDAGPTTLAAANRLGLEVDHLEALYLTHLHGDHIAGWPFLVLDYTFRSRRSRPFHVFGPEGTRERLDVLAGACYGELLTGKNLPFAVENREIPVAEQKAVAGIAGTTFDVVPLEHDVTSIGYRFHLEGSVVGVSGDTRWCPELEELADGCDLLVTECTFVSPADAAHLSVEELRLQVDRLRAKRIILVHLDKAVEAALNEKPVPRCVTGQDGMVVEV